MRHGCPHDENVADNFQQSSETLSQFQKNAENIFGFQKPSESCFCDDYARQHNFLGWRAKSYYLRLTQIR
jgi:hypothetical protein